jgi:hypothetical protein
MPTSLEQGQSSNCTNPILDLFHRLNGVLTDLHSLEYIIYERISDPPNLTQTYPETGRATVDTSDCPVGHKVSLGRYVAEWDVPVDQLTGDHVVRWFWQSTASSPERQSEFEFSVLPTGAVAGIEGYCTVQDIRDEGFSDAIYSDTRVETAIEIASRFIERATGRWFGAKTRTFRVKARNSRMLELPAPIVSITEVNIVTGRGDSIDRDEVDTDDIIVYNRHLTEGMIDPDDRDFPRIEYVNPAGYDYPGRDDAVWPWGQQIVEVQGRFGYTALAATDTPGETSDGSQVPNSEGVVPPLIVHACKLLTVRELAEMGDPAGRDDLRSGWRLEQEKTVDQMYKKTALSSLGMIGKWTGDPEIDGILAMYVTSASMGIV